MRVLKSVSNGIAVEVFFRLGPRPALIHRSRSRADRFLRLIGRKWGAVLEIAEAKAALRRSLLSRILAMDPADHFAQEQALFEKLATLPGFNDAAVVLMYVRAFPEEIDTAPMLRLVLERGSRLVCPRVFRAERRLRLFEVRDLVADFEPGVLRIPEPKPSCREVSPDEVDWTLAPGLGFDRRGYRIGRGAGHYDRLLPKLRPDAPAWALMLTPQWVEDMPIESHDHRLTGVADFRETLLTSIVG